jgi:hypothetical protein
LQLFPPEFKGEESAYKRVRRLVHGESVQRSDLSEERLTEKLQTAAMEQLKGAEEVWMVLDSTDLRKPHAEQMEALMMVRDLEGKAVPGYRVLNALAITPGARALLYHRLFSSHEEGFKSEPHEYREAVRSVGRALERAGKSPAVTWLLDRAFDDQAFWGVVWEQGDQLVTRLKHLDRIIQAPDGEGQWQETKVEPYGFSLPEVTRFQTKLRVRVGRQKKSRLQEVTVILYGGPMEVRYQVGRETEQEPQSRRVWLLRVQVLGSDMRLWLMTDHPVDSAEGARRVYQMYRMRWSVEDAFKFIKQSLGWEEVQLLSLQGVRSLVALAAVAAGFLFQWGVTLEWDAIQLLAKLGGWIPRKNAKPGRIILTRGLRRLIDTVTARAVLREYKDLYGRLPPQVAEFVPDDFV